MIPATAIAIIIVSFLTGMHKDVCGCDSCHRYHRAEGGRIGPYGRPSDWPNDGPGFHDCPKNYDDDYDDEDDYFVGAR